VESFPAARITGFTGFGDKNRLVNTASCQLSMHENWPGFTPGGRDRPAHLVIDVAAAGG